MGNTYNPIIAPSLLSADFSDMEQALKLIEKSGGDWVHFDVMDGLFVPDITFGHKMVNDMRKRSGLPFDVHLMVYHPERYFSGFQQAGARRAVFHYEAAPSPGEVINSDRILGLEVGLALNPETPVAVVMPFIGDIDSVLLLSVNPGFYGSPFIHDVLDKVGEHHSARLDIEIGIDIGIKESHISQVAGPFLMPSI